MLIDCANLQIAYMKKHGKSIQAIPTNTVIITQSFLVFYSHDRYFATGYMAAAFRDGKRIVGEKESGRGREREEGEHCKEREGNACIIAHIFLY